MLNSESASLGFFDFPSGIWIDVQLIGGTRGAENDESDEENGSDDDKEQYRFHLGGASPFGRTGVRMMPAGRTAPHN